jgi:hypothetical protein
VEAQIARNAADRVRAKNQKKSDSCVLRAARLARLQALQTEQSDGADGGYLSRVPDGAALHTDGTCMRGTTPR